MKNSTDDMKTRHNIEWKTSNNLVNYHTALETMESRVADIYQRTQSELIWLLEHDPLYTAGTSSQKKDLLDPNRFPVHQVGRGGEYTYHGPGQRIAYTLLDLKQRGSDVRLFVQNLEAWIIDTLAEFGVKGERREGRIGIWVTNSGTEKKIAAIGIRIRHWITFHGIAINVNPNLEHFSGIVPCGNMDYGITSLNDLKINCSMKDVDEVLRNKFFQRFVEH